jgi:hypothetical protein
VPQLGVPQVSHLLLALQVPLPRSLPRACLVKQFLL